MLPYYNIVTLNVGMSFFVTFLNWSNQFQIIVTEESELILIFFAKKGGLY